MPDHSMWLKIRAKYKGATRIVTTWNPLGGQNKTGAGKQLEWPWGSGPPPLFATRWTVVGMDRWHDFDGEEGEELKRRNAAELNRLHMKARFAKKGNKRGDVDPTKL